MHYERFLLFALTGLLSACAAGADPSGQTEITSLTQQSASTAEPATAEEIRTALVGRTVIFERGDEATYGQNGDYRHFGFGRVSTGKYTITDGEICITFEPRPGTTATQSRCDRISKRGDAFFLTTEQGRTTAIRLK